MNDYYLEPDQSIIEKLLKVYEEFEEVVDSFKVENNNSDKAQEILDLILSSLNLLKKMEREELIDVQTELFKHQLKLNRYLENGKYKK
ncbi:MAG: hypothetical protein ACRCX2_20880 [Paraclostridium sp.]